MTVDVTSYGVLLGPAACPVIIPFSSCCQSHIEKEEELFVSFVEVSQSEDLPSEVLRRVKEAFKDKLFMPNTDSITRLLYLTTIDKENPKSLFSKTQVDAFQLSERAATATKRWLIGGFLMGTMLSIGGVVGAFRLFSNWSSENEAEAFSYFTCLTTGASLLAYSATGWNPDFASNAANEWQNQESAAHETIEEMAWELIDLNRKNPKLAVEIASHISIEGLNTSIKRDDPHCRPKFIAALEQARAVVLGETIIRTNLVVNLALQNQELIQRLEKLKERLDKIEEIKVSV